MADEEKKDESRLPLREYLDLRLKAFRSEMRLLIFASIAGNQLISHVTLGAPKVALGAVLFSAIHLVWR